MFFENKNNSINSVVALLKQEIVFARGILLTGLQVADQLDIMQDALIKLIRRHRPDESREEIVRKFWWCVRESRKEFRHRAQANDAEPYEEDTFQFSGNPNAIHLDSDPMDNMRNSQARRAVREALRQSGLRIEQQVIVILRHAEKWDVGEIAEALAISKELVSSRLHQAKQQLKGMLGEMKSDGTLLELSIPVGPSDRELLISDLIPMNGRRLAEKALIILHIVYDLPLPELADALQLKLTIARNIIDKSSIDLA